MRIACPSCRTAYSVMEEKIPPTGGRLKCTRCKTTFPIFRPPPVEQSPEPSASQVRRSIPEPTPRQPEPPAQPSGRFDLPPEPSAPAPESANPPDLFSDLGFGSSSAPDEPFSLGQVTGETNAISWGPTPDAPPAPPQSGAPLGFGERVLPSDTSTHQVSAVFGSAAMAVGSTSFKELDLGNEPSVLAIASPAMPSAKEVPQTPSQPPPRLRSDTMELSKGMRLPAAADQSPFDDAAEVTGQQPQASSGAEEMWMVRRKNGKTFGPFDGKTIERMLASGKLLGNEDASADGATYLPLGALDRFAAQVKEHLANASDEAQVPSMPTVSAEASSTGERSDIAEKLKSLYGNRMAAVAIAQESDDWESKVGKRIPLIVVGLLLLGIVGFGLYLGTTPYGYFGMRRLFPRTLSEGSAAYAQYRESLKAIDEDTWPSYRRALDTAQAMLADNDSVIESRALFVQSVFQVTRRYGTASEKIPTAKKYLDELTVTAKDKLEVIKARAGAHLAAGEAAASRALLEATAAQHPEDPEFVALLAEGYLMDGKADAAADALKKLPKLDANPKALHLLGSAESKKKNPDISSAIARFDKALELDPKHLLSAVEAARLELAGERVSLEAVASARKHLDLALAEEAKKLLAPNERAHALYLLGDAHAAAHENAEAQKAYEEALKAAPELAVAKAAYARFALRERNFKKAVELFEAASKLAPREVEYIDGLVRALIGDSRLVTATKVLSDASDSHPGNPRIAYLSGRVAAEEGKTEDAERAFRRAIKGDAALWEAQYYLGQLLLWSGKIDESKEPFEAALAAAPASPLPLIGLGEYLLAKNDTEGATAQFRKALELAPHQAEAHLGLARIYRSTGDLESARKELQSAIESDATASRAHTDLGILQWEARETTEAEQSFEKALAANPRDVGAAWRLGATRLELGKVQEALNALESALALSPGHAEALLYKARALYARHDNTQAIDTMKSALERDPSRPDFHYWMGQVFFQGERVAAAFDEWNEAIKRKPDYADAHVALAKAFQEQAKPAEAIDYYKKAIDIGAEKAPLLEGIGDCLSMMHKPTDAITHYREALSVNEKLLGVQFKIARVYNEMGNIKSSIEWYRKVRPDDPKAAEAWKYLGFAYKESGQKREAIAAFEKYLASDVTKEDVTEIKDEIYDLKH